MIHDTMGEPLVQVPKHVRETVDKYREATGLMVGDLDVVISNQTWVVDPGSFPSYSDWKGAGQKVAQLMLEQVQS